MKPYTYPCQPSTRRPTLTALLTFTRFFCGCIYRTLDDQAVFYPQHRQEPHRAYATGTERVPIPSQDNFPIRGLVMSRYFKSHPAVLQNSSSNSLHTIVSTKDGRNEEWDTPEPELLGLCTACFIDHEQRDETRIAMCECGDEDCSYRWCGSLDGLHAFWRLHTQAASEQATGLAELDIFSYGPFQDQQPHIQETLNQQRKDLVMETEQLCQDVMEARRLHSPSGRSAPPTGPAAYLNPWLDPECRRLAENPDRRDARIYKRSLLQKVRRLHIIGAMPLPKN